MGGKFIISLDFEKYWGMIDVIGLDGYKGNLDNVDDVVRGLLDKFKEYDIHATWGVVGFLFHNSKEELIKKMPKDIEFYSDHSLNPYNYIKDNELDERYHFANKLIKDISSTPNQEIASHTYSHYYCFEEGQDEKNFIEDIELFKSVCEDNDCNASTIIFPRNQDKPEYNTILQKYGINAYRGNEENFIYDPEDKKGSIMVNRGLRLMDRYINITGHNTYKIDKSAAMYNVKSSRFLAPYMKKLDILEGLRKRRIKNAMTYAAKNDEVFHMWWHPHNFGMNTIKNMNFLEDILKHYTYLKEEYGMKSLNIREAVNEVEVN